MSASKVSLLTRWCAADAALATCLMDAMRLLPTPPPADQPRTAALIFTALLLTASTAGRGAAGFLM